MSMWYFALSIVTFAVLCESFSNAEIWLTMYTILICMKLSVIRTVLLELTEFSYYRHWVHFEYHCTQWVMATEVFLLSWQIHLWETVVISCFTHCSICLLCLMKKLPNH